MTLQLRSCWLLAVLMLSASEHAASLVLDTRREIGDFDRATRQHQQDLPLNICLDYCNVLQLDRSSPVSDGPRLVVPRGVQGLLLCILADQCKGVGRQSPAVYRIQGRNNEEVEYNCLYPNCQQNSNQLTLPSSDSEDRSFEALQGGDGVGIDEDGTGLILASKRGFSDISDVCIEFHCSAKTPGSFGYLKCVSDNRCLGR